MAEPHEIREGFHEAMTFTLKHKVGVDFVPFDITGYTRVILKRHSGSGTIDQIDTANNPAELQVISAPAGTIRLLPTPTYWRNVGEVVKLHFDVIISGRIYMFPTRERDDIIINISEG
jgi:hypothetical protein